jgi:tetratricopeptide (TPR) repeat protein
MSYPQQPPGAPFQGPPIQGPQTFSPEPPPSVPVFRRARFWRIAAIVFAAIVVGWCVKQFWGPFWKESHRANIRSALQGDDLDKALAACNRAIEAHPEELPFYLTRAEIFRLKKEYAAALKDCDFVLKENPSAAEAYLIRAQVRHMLRDYRGAVADYTEVRKWLSETEFGSLNERAYARALGKFELTEALEDAQKAVQGLAEVEPPAKAPTQARLEWEEGMAAYLDTRGYIFHLLGEQEKGLADLDRALDLMSNFAKYALDPANTSGRKPGAAARLQANIHQTLGTLHHHRGLIYEALGKTTEAEADFKKRDEYGFDPAKE